MIRSAAAVTAILTLVLMAVFVTGAPAQQPVPLQTELLGEVRLLRQAIEGLAGNNARVQLAFGRLQLQEQRTTAAAKRLDDLRAGLRNVDRQAAETADRLKDFEALGDNSARKPEEIEDMKDMLAMMRRESVRLEAERVRLTGEEAEAASVLNLEQGRWSDLNRQLEELERALAKQ
jgi:hypothetical protein